MRLFDVPRLTPKPVEEPSRQRAPSTGTQVHVFAVRPVIGALSGAAASLAPDSGLPASRAPVSTAVRASVPPSAELAPELPQPKESVPAQTTLAPRASRPKG